MTAVMESLKLQFKNVCVGLPSVTAEFYDGLFRLVGIYAGTECWNPGRIGTMFQGTHNFVLSFATQGAEHTAHFCIILFTLQ